LKVKVMKLKLELAIVSILTLVAASSCAKKEVKTVDKQTMVVNDLTNAALGNGLFARISTSKGNIVLKLDYDHAPLAVCNFVSLTEGTMTNCGGKPFYNGLTFHRVISKANGDAQNFMIQGGDPLGTGQGGPGYQFPDETSPSDNFDHPGIAAMANSGPDTNGSQFFITIAPAPWLNGSYTIFGQVVQGQDVVDSIVKGDKMNTITIIRNGPGANAFKTGQAAFDALFKQHTAAEAEKARAKRDKDMKEIAARYPGLTTTPDNIQYKIIKAGNGRKPQKGDTVSIAYKATFIDGKLFDQATADKPMQASIGKLIPGMDETLRAMQPGEERLVVLPPELAYGEKDLRGNDGSVLIPGNSFLVFDITLLAVQ
jgi:peptidylprolyl isomerase